MDVSWLRAEAARQGLDLTDEDLVSIAQQLERTRRALASARPAETLGLEPAYRFAARRSARHTRPDDPRRTQDMHDQRLGPRARGQKGES